MDIAEDTLKDKVLRPNYSIHKVLKQLNASKDAAAKSLETTKAIFASKSINEAIAIQTGFAKSAFEAYVGQIKKVSELYGRTAKDSIEPLKTRSDAFMSLIAENTRAV